jgi:hypothetical protein
MGTQARRYDQSRMIVSVGCNHNISKMLVIGVIERRAISLFNGIVGDYSSSLLCKSLTTVMENDYNFPDLIKFWFSPDVAYSDPSPLILMEVVDCSLQSFSRLRSGSVRNSVLPFVAALSFSKSSASDTDSIAGRVGSCYCCTSLLAGVVGISPCDKNQQNRTCRLDVSRQVRWAIVITCYLATALLTVIAFAIFVWFDRRQWGWGWGLLRCAGIPVSIFAGWHLIRYSTFSDRSMNHET